MACNRLYIELRRLWRALLRLTVWCSGVILFTLVGQAILGDGETALDHRIADMMERIRNPALTSASQVVTRLGDGWSLSIVALLGVAVLCARRHWRSGLYLAVSAAGAGLLNGLLKVLFARPRPTSPLIPAEGFAFPSGHSMGSAAVYGALAVIAASRYPSVRAPVVAAAIALVMAIGCTRAYLGVHHASDVVAGWALGATWPLWLKPVILGSGFWATRITASELRDDNFSPAALRERERAKGHERDSPR